MRLTRRRALGQHLILRRLETTPRPDAQTMDKREKPLFGSVCRESVSWFSFLLSFYFKKKVIRKKTIQEKARPGNTSIGEPKLKTRPLGSTSRSKVHQVLFLCDRQVNSYKDERKGRRIPRKEKIKL